MTINSLVRTFVVTLLFSSLMVVAQDNLPPANLTGAGTTNFIPRWTGTHTLGNSTIFQTSSGNVGLGTKTPAAKLDVNGAVQIHGTAFSIDTNGHVHFVSGQKFPG